MLPTALYRSESYRLFLICVSLSLMKEAIPMNSPGQSRYSEPDHSRDYKDAERLMLGQADP